MESTEQAGLIYGSMTEDVLTGLKIHGRGWRSVLYSPKRRAFLGAFPAALEDLLTMRRRWATGFLEMLLLGGANSPLFILPSLLLRTTASAIGLPSLLLSAGSALGLPKLSLRQRLVYLHALLIFSAGLGIPLTVYALLPAASLLLRRPLYPSLSVRYPLILP
jgi:cellulose synthase/poly-beta-1,6-N-acetylglucosamine synthase-like glycosyltransferase